MRNTVLRRMAICLALLAAPAAAEPAFRAKPSITEARGKLVVKFAVTEPTDVEVAILDGDGKVVRHLAAGMLGGNPPKPFRKGLAQQLVWDGTGDTGRQILSPPKGKPVKAAKVRVRIGSSAKIDRYLGFDGNTTTDFIAGLAVGPKGEVYVLTTYQTYGRTELRVLDRSGKYLRTILPYPAGTPEGRLASIGRLDVGGSKLPIVYNAHAHSVAPLTAGMQRQSMCFSPKGHVVLTSAVGTITNHGPPRHLLAVHPKGGAPDGLSFVGPEIVRPRGFIGGAGERGAAAYDGIATSPDGEWIYLTTNIEHRAFKKRRKHCVWRVKWSDKSVGEPFLGKAEPGDDDEHLNDPQGVAADAKGNLYVCDRGNNRVMVFSPKAKLLGKIDVEQPQQIAVHPTTGVIYVVSRPPGVGHKIPGTTLRKFAPFASGKTKELMAAELKKKAVQVFAIDPTSPAPRLWAVVCTGWKRFELVTVTETGGGFVFGKSVLNAAGLNYPLFVHADAARGCLYVSDCHAGVKRLDLKTGRLTGVLGRSRANEAVPAGDGSLYVTRGWKLTLARTDAAGKALDFASGAKALGPWPMGKMSDGKRQAWARSKGPHVGDRGHCVAPGGDLYVIVMTQYGPGRVDVYAPDGTLKKQGLVDNLPHGTSGIDVDAAGNVYLGVNLRPVEGKVFPHGFDAVLPEGKWVYWRAPRQAPWRYPYFNTYLYHWGGVMKFSPKGGRFYIWGGQGRRKIPRPDDVPADAKEYRSGYLTHRIAVAGAEWLYRGCGPVPTMGLNWGDPSCTCVNSRLSVDGYGRVFAPDVFRFCVAMLDAAGNEIARIGRYGNADDGLGAKPAVAFAWPAFTDAGGGKLYVADPVNRRVAVVNFTHAAEAACPLP